MNYNEQNDINVVYCDNGVTSAIGLSKYPFGPRSPILTGYNLSNIRSAKQYSGSGLLTDLELLQNFSKYSLVPPF